MDEHRPSPEPSALALPLDRAERMLREHGQVGLLCITVLEREGGRPIDGDWTEYNRTLKSIQDFLPGYLEQRMRRADLLLEPAGEGNSFVMLLSPPRRERLLDLIDLHRVRRRLARGLEAHLEVALHDAAGRRFGVYVGGALARQAEDVPPERIVRRSLHAAFADALWLERAEVVRRAAVLKRLLHRSDIYTVYQPVVDLAERRVVGVEALTRASEPLFRNPATLFREAQRQGALWRLERLTRRRALESLPALDASQLLFLNVEPESIHDPELAGPDQLEAIRLVGLEPQRIVLEITEHAVVRDFSSLRESLRRCRDAGFRLAMDDVGSGYAGLQAIAEIGPDFLKVDMSLVRDVHLHPIKRELCATIQRFADSTRVTLVAEGVETIEELESLTEAGVRCAQGYLFARPDRSLVEPDWTTLDRRTTGTPSS